MVRRSSRGLTVDSEMQSKWAAEVPVEKHAQDVADWVKIQSENALFLEAEGFRSANYQKQLGHALTHEQLEARLQKLIPQLKFEYSEFNSTKRRAYLELDGEKVTVCAYEAAPEGTPMPERSVIFVKDTILPDPSVKKVSRQDLPKYHQLPDGSFKFEGPPLGTKTILEPYGEAVRGWRTVLLYCVIAGLVSPAAVEAEFGADNTANWAYHLKKRADARVPW